jgi:hypothetical protein
MPVEFGVAGFVHHAHTAFAELAGDFILMEGGLADYLYLAEFVL